MLEVERLLSYPKDFEYFFLNRSMRVLVARTAKFLSTKICLYPTQPGEHPRSLSHLGLNGFEETFGKLAPTE